MTIHSTDDRKRPNVGFEPQEIESAKQTELSEKPDDVFILIVKRHGGQR